jgi:glycyl-tRNA synthetase
MSDKMEAIVSLCKRRGFIFPSGDIYGGLKGFWDYGPLGARLKKNIRDAWWRDMIMASPVDVDTRQPLTIVPFESSIITNPEVWYASGHVETFKDTFLTCPSCKKEAKHDTWSVKDEVFAVSCPNCGKEIEDTSKATADLLKTARTFDLMFKSEAGVVDGDKTPVYLRPETAQGIFVNFNNILQTNRLKIPFGVAQIGKAFRNEVTPRHFTFRSREFEQMEIEWFCRHVGDMEAHKWLDFWRDVRFGWWQNMGLSKLRVEKQSQEDLAHYAKDGAGTYDIQYEFPWGWEELEGIAHRTDYDLRRHSEKSGIDLQYFDQEREQKYFPHVVEPSAGLDRGVLAVLCEAYTVDESRPCKAYMRIEPRIAPIKCAFLPLVNRDGMTEFAFQLFQHYRRKYDCVFEEKQSIGKRYAKMDEIGTPFCITIDGDTLSSHTVTVRNRDTTEQQRIDLKLLDSFLTLSIG